MALGKEMEREFRKNRRRREKQREQFFDGGIGLLMIFIAMIIAVIEMIATGIGNLFF